MNIPEPVTNSLRHYDVVNDIFEEQKIMLENNIETGYRSAVDVYPVDRKEYNKQLGKAYIKAFQPIVKPVAKVLEPKLKPIAEKLSDKVNKVLKKREEVKEKKN